MKVMLIDSGRGHSPELVEGTRDALGLTDDDQLVWVAWQPAPDLLPVEDHLVAGPRLRSRVRHEPTIDRATSAAGAEARAARAAGAGAGAATVSTNGTPGSLGAALRDPQRLKAAAAWRVNRARIAARSTARRGAASAQRRLKGSDRMPARVLSSALDIVNVGPGTKFGLSLSRHPEALRLAASVDVIVAYDTPSQKAAWLIARKVPGPAVVAGLVAGRRAVDEVREAPPQDG